MRPLAIRIYAFAFGLSCLFSLGLAWIAAGATDFGFPLTETAAHTLAARILYIRLAGLGFALWLMAMVVHGRSRAARGALVARWMLGLVTSIAFLRGIGVLHPGAMGGPGIIVMSIAQLTLEGLSILVLFGDDAAVWFAPRPVFEPTKSARTTGPDALRS